MAALKQISCNRSFTGYQKVFQHTSQVVKCEMKFGAYIPDHNDGEKLPLLLYLSGLTCTEENFIMKSGFQRFASKHRVVVVNADTSPRIADQKSDDWTVGPAASFYVNATQPEWSKYQMYSYIVEELTPLAMVSFNIDKDRVGIFGHSMGGHGAITIGLRNPDAFKSISAFAPICNPSSCPVGQKPYTVYLGTDKETWKCYDSTELAKIYGGPARVILIDQGDADGFYKDGNLVPENLIAVSNPSIKIDFKLRPGYDHGYFCVSTFMEEHFDYHIGSWP